MTFKRPSDIYFVRAGEGSVGKGVGFTLTSVLLGGESRGARSIRSRRFGTTREDVTREVVSAGAQPQAIPTGAAELSLVWKLIIDVTDGSGWQRNEKRWILAARIIQLAEMLKLLKGALE